MDEVKSCLGFAIDCGTLWKGAGVTVMAFILFVGSVYVLLSAILGRYMGFLVLIVAFSGWMVIQSSLWLFGFYSQGLETPTNLGPRGSEPAWVVLEASPGSTSDPTRRSRNTPPVRGRSPTRTTLSRRPTSRARAVPSPRSSPSSSTRNWGSPRPIPPRCQGTQFSVDSIKFSEAEDGKTKLAVVESHFNGGGPQWTVSLYYDSGSVPRYSYMFLGGSIIIFLAFLPLLDRAEKKRKEFLTGGERTRLVRTRVAQRTEARREAMIGAESIPLLDQGSVQFILLGVTILVTAFLMWITIAK